ncbi:MAG: NAD-dependent epimerase/dehydratase family protein [Myxococcota bacterium]
MRVLLTGAAGFIGSHVAGRLLARGDEVVGLDNFDPFYERPIKERNLASLPGGIELLEGDIRAPDFLERVFAPRQFDAVVHLAALAGVRPSIQAPTRYADVNVVGTARLADAMVKHDVSLLVFASSSSVYGGNPDVPYRESQRVDRPASPYAATKRSAELLLSTYQALFGLDVRCLRFFTVYGPRQRPEMAIHKFCRLIDEGAAIPMFGDGSSSRDYTFVDDIVSGTVAALDRAPAGFQLYNLGNTKPISLRGLIAKIEAAVGKQALIQQLPAQPGDVPQTWADVSKAEAELGYHPTVDLDRGLATFVEWMRNGR